MSFGRPHSARRTRRLTTWLTLCFVLSLIGLAGFSWLPQTEAATEVAGPPPPHRPYAPIEEEPEAGAPEGQISLDGVVVSDPTDSLRPQVAFDSQGNAHMVWHEGEGAPSNAVRYAKGTFNGSGYTWSGPLDVYRPGGSSTYIYPRIAVDKNDEVQVVWTFNSTVYYKHWPATSTPASGSAPQPLGSGIYPSIAVGPNNHLHVVWEYAAGGGDFDILYREFTGSGFTTAIDISKNSSNSLSPDVAVDSNNNVYAVWYDLSPAKILFAGRVNGSWSNPLTVSESQSYFPSIEADNSGCVHMGWASFGIQKAVYRKYCNGQFVFTTEQGSTDSPRASVGVTPGGRAVLVWEQKRNSVFNIAYSTIVGTQVTPQQWLEPVGVRQFWPDVSSSNLGQLGVVWQQDVGGRFDPAFSAIGCPAGSASGTAVRPQVLANVYYLPVVWAPTRGC